MLLIQVKLEKAEVEVEEVVDPGKVEVEEVDLGSEAGQHRLTESLAALLDLLKKDGILQKLNLSKSRTSNLD